MIFLSILGCPELLSKVDCSVVGWSDCADVKAEDVGRQAAEELLRNLDHGGCVDDYLQDQVQTFITQSLLI